MRMYPYMNGKMLFGQGEPETPRRGVNKAEIIGLVIIVAIALAIIGGLGGTVASGITSMSNTTAIAGYSTWSAQTQSSFTGTAANMSLTWFLLPLLMIVSLAKGF